MLEIGHILSLIAIVIALSAYLSSVRQRMYDLKRKETDPDRKASIGKAISAILIADVPLIITGGILMLAFAFRYFGAKIEIIESVGLLVMGVALCGLIYLHMCEWGKKVE